jgi:cytochrome c-type biogenesis protein CcmH/NrfG
MAGAHFEQMVAILPPVDPWLQAAAIEQTDRKSLRPESLQTSQKNQSNP